jgi:hypothetical protein
MTGTFILSKQRSVDVRTVDFLRIAGAIRTRGLRPSLARKVLESIDDFGMNMIRADELSVSEFVDFHMLMKELQEEFDDLPGFDRLLSELLRLIEADERLGAK